jgi:glutamate-1-semialdehyde aminotransferase
MEVERNLKLKIKFLKGIKKICEEKNLILIFDECSSGFRETYGGLHLKYKIDPDIAVFGKSIANGIPLTVVIGSKNIMDKASKSFISSTFWSDTMAPAVGLATLKKMKKIKSWKKITKTGKIIKKKWKQLARKYKLKIIVSGIDAMPTFQFKSKKNWYYRNYLVQEFLKNKILATNTVYCCVHHEKYLNIYFKILEKIFFEISKFEKNLNVSDFLEYPTANQGFERLN